VSTTAAPAPPARRTRDKRPRAGLIGPLFRWELVRLARRGQDARARFILAVALLFVLTVFTFAWFPNLTPSELFVGTSQVLPLAESARFGEQFALAFILAQLGVLVLLTPAYAAGGISEEKEKKTFVFLLVSDLTSREILLGKFLGRLAFVLGVMLAGLPVLAITQVYGGVSLKFLLVGYLITATTVTMLAAVSAAAACATDTFRGALFRGYGLAALHVLVGCGLHPILSPFGIIALLFGIEANAP
jgi:ABC-type transport system involved in multi-copper enzyme maturation permease subunit